MHTTESFQFDLTFQSIQHKRPFMEITVPNEAIVTSHTQLGEREAMINLPNLVRQERVARVQEVQQVGTDHLAKYIKYSVKILRP